jgi:hypothetical protein
VVDSLAYEFAPDDPPALADRLWSLLQGRAIDEITGEPLAALEASVAEPELGVRDGRRRHLHGVRGPWHRFPPLAAAGYPLHLTIAADGYIATTQVATIPSHQRLLSAPAPAIGANVITLSSNAGLVMGQRLLIGPAGRTRKVARSRVSVRERTRSRWRLPSSMRTRWACGRCGRVRARRRCRYLMHRAPGDHRRRSVRRNASGIGTTPVANASIAVQGLWRTAQGRSPTSSSRRRRDVSLAPDCMPRARSAPRSPPRTCRL